MKEVKSDDVFALWGYANKLIFRSNQVAPLVLLSLIYLIPIIIPFFIKDPSDFPYLLLAISLIIGIVIDTVQKIGAAALCSYAIKDKNLGVEQLAGHIKTSFSQVVAAVIFKIFLISLAGILMFLPPQIQVILQVVWVLFIWVNLALLEYVMMFEGKRLSQAIVKAIKLVIGYRLPVFTVIMLYFLARILANYIEEYSLLLKSISIIIISLFIISVNAVLFIIYYTSTTRQNNNAHNFNA